MRQYRLGMMAALIALIAGAGCMQDSLRAVRHPRFQPDVYPILAAAPVPGPSAYQPNAAQAALVVNPEAGNKRVLKIGDFIKIQLIGPPDARDSAAVIDENGEVNMYLIGYVHVAGLSCSEAAKLAESKYIPKYYPRVKVVILPPEGEYIVQGEVLKPGAYPISRDMPLMEALGRAGRYTEWADKTSIKIIRGSRTMTVDAALIEKGDKPDIMIKPGDVIIVP